MQSIFKRTEEVVFPSPPKDKKVQTGFGTICGEPVQPKLVPLTKEQYAYLSTLMPQEKKKLPRRDDARFPSALDAHMKAFKVQEYTEEDRKQQEITKNEYSDKFRAIMNQYQR